MIDSTDNELVTKVILQQCNQSLKTLIERHSPLCFDIFKKYNKILQERGISPEDLVSEKDYIIYKCTLNFDETQNSKFSTWLANHVKYKCLTNITKHKWAISLDDENQKNIAANLCQEINDFEEKKEFVFNLLSQMKDKRLEKIIMLRYYGDKSSRKWKNISKELGVTYQTAITLHKKALEFLKTKIESKEMQDFV